MILFVDKSGPDAGDGEWMPVLSGLDTPDEPVSNWTVAWASPKGVFMSLEAALTWCRENDMDPNMMLRPVVCAKTETTYEVFT